MLLSRLILAIIIIFWLISTSKTTVSTTVNSLDQSSYTNISTTMDTTHPSPKY